MLGNALEWCFDRYGDYPAQKDKVFEDTPSTQPVEDRNPPCVAWRGVLLSTGVRPFGLPLLRPTGRPSRHFGFPSGQNLPLSGFTALPLSQRAAVDSEVDAVKPSIPIPFSDNDFGWGEPSLKSPKARRHGIPDPLRWNQAGP